VGDSEARALVHRWWDGVWSQGDLAIIDEICTDPYTRHTGTGTERLSREEYKQRLARTREVLQGAETTIDDQVVDGDRVWTRATSRGVQLASVERPVMTWMVLHRIEGGRLAEVWAATLPGVEWDA
jgi:ketosteroid isomerase-like protein